MEKQDVVTLKMLCYRVYATNDCFSDPDDSNKIKPLLELDKIDIYKLEKKIQAEEYKTRLVFSFGGARLVIYPKLQKPAGFTVISK